MPAAWRSAPFLIWRWLRLLAREPARSSRPQQPSAFVQIAPNGEVTVTINRLEFGQGVNTALPMILAEELDADWSLVRSRHGTNDVAYADPLFGIHLTGGSNTIKNSFTQYRELGARARAMLLSAAAARWKVDVATLRTQAGTVLGPGGRKLGYGELAEAAMALPVPETVKLKDPKDFRIIGRPTQRLDARAKTSGKQDFGIDIRLPGQLTAVVARPPVFGGRLASIDDSAARAVKGVKAVLRVPLDGGAEGVAVVADGYWQATQGRDALKLEWDISKVEKVDSEKQLAQYRELAGQPGPRKMDADMAPLATAPRQLEAEFVFPYLAHAAMEPLNCTVAAHRRSRRAVDRQPVRRTRCRRGGVGARPQARAGRRATCRWRAAASAGASRAPATSSSRPARSPRRRAPPASNVPVRTLWSREDDMRGGYYRPMHLHRARIGFDDTRQGAGLGPCHRRPVHHGWAPCSQLSKSRTASTRTATEGMREPYPLPMRLTVHHPKLNVPVLWWRSVGSTHTAFVMETLIDDIARTTKQDPVAYRMALFGDTARAPPRRAATGGGQERLWQDEARAAGRAWGVAVHEFFNSVVAYVVEASVKDGQPLLHQVTSGVHCNLAVNPRSVEAQVQGAAVMGLSMCLAGSAITLKDGVVEQSNFGDFTVARITDMPQFDVHIVPSADPPTGMGEPGLPPLAPAFANAIARLTGKPQRQLPFKLA